MKHDVLLERVHYNPVTGAFKWKIDVGGRAARRAGDPAGCERLCKRRQTKELVIGICCETHLASRLAWFYMTGAWPKHEIDHRNGDGLDNRWDNLRPATRFQNEANRGARRTSRTGFRGVHPSGRGYQASIYRNGHRRFLGTFTNVLDAAAAYATAAKRSDGEFFHSA